MYKYVKKLLKKRLHADHEINKELLYKNRLRKSAFVLPLLIFAFTLNTILIYLTKVYQLPSIISVNILQFYFLIITFLCLVFMPYHRKHYGFNLRGLRRNLVSGTMFGLMGLLVSVSIRCTMYSSGQLAYGFYFDPLVEIIRLFSYLLFSFSQEAVTKGFFQSYFFAIFDGNKLQRVWAVLLGAVVFAQFHIIYDFGLVLVTFIYGVFSGFFYEKTRSLTGVFIMHFLCGAGIFFFSRIN